MICSLTLLPATAIIMMAMTTRAHVSICDPDPCLNDGTCTDSGNHLFSCSCPEPFHGKYCELSNDECNRTYDVNTVFSTPGYPNPYSMDGCVITLKAPHSARINLTLDTIWLRRSPDGTENDNRCIDNLQICDGAQCLQSNTIDSLCDPTGSLNFVSYSNYLTLNLKHATMDERISLPFTGFRGQFIAEVMFCDSGYDCENGGICHEGPSSIWCACPAGTTGAFCEAKTTCEAPCNNIITSPGWPYSYEAEANCKWDLISNSGQVTHLNFITMDLAVEADGSCDADILIVDQTSGTNMQVCTIPERASPVESHFVLGPEVTILFSGGSIGKHAGFMLEYRNSPDFCATNPCGTFEKCLNLMDGFTCVTDDVCHNYLCINGGSCYVNGTTPFCVCSSGYHGDHCEIDNPCHSFACENGGTCNSSSKGAECRCLLEYEGRHCERRKCGQNFVNLFSGSFSSPGYPSGYAPNQECYWLINSPPNSTIYLQFLTFALGRKDCLYISDEIMTVNACGSPSSKPAPIEARNSILYVHFKASNSVAMGTGFYASFEVHMDGDTICKYYCFNNGTCSVTQKIPSCKCLSGFSGAQCQQDLLCDPNPCLNGGHCEHANGSRGCICPEEYTGQFCEKVKCGGKINAMLATEAKPGTITSPGFPKPYPRLCNCRWDLGTNNDTSLSLEFLLFELEANPACTLDYVTISVCYTDIDCQPYSLNKTNYCQEASLSSKVFKVTLFGDNEGSDFAVPFLRLEFHSDSENTGYFRGFLLRYYTSPGACQSRNCQNGATCIETRSGRPRCACASGFSGSNCEIDIWCQQHPCKNFGTCHRNATDYWCSCPPGLYGDQCEEVGCGGSLTTPSGSFQSPLAEFASFVPHTKCIWNITTDVGTAINFHAEGNTSAGVSCNSKLLWISYPNRTSNVTDKEWYCGAAQATSYSMSIRTAMNLAFVEYYVGEDLLNFEAHYTSEPVDECRSSPCQNNGTCVSASYTFHCTCEHESKVCFGRLCNTCVNSVCDLLPPGMCEHGGTCIPGADPRDYRCSCRAGWTGQHCDVPTTTKSTPLLNSVFSWPTELKTKQDDGFAFFDICDAVSFLCSEGSTCVRDYYGRDFHCKCPTDRTGKFCDIVV